jgi:hypothetical protein
MRAHYDVTRDTVERFMRSCSRARGADPLNGVAIDVLKTMVSSD